MAAREGENDEARAASIRARLRLGMARGHICGPVRHIARVVACYPHP